MGWAALFYCGTPLAFHIIILDIPVYSTSLDKGLSTRKPIEWHRLAIQVEVQIRDYLSTGKTYPPTIIKSQVHFPLGASL